MKNHLAALAICIATAPAPRADAAKWTGNASLESTYFLQGALHPAQSDSNVSIAFEPEFFHSWDDDNQRVIFAPFLRADQNDPRRSHADLREFYWQRSFPNVELAVGLRKIFWGVTETAHLVDIINQTDFVENLDGEDKLGQPMVSLRWLPDWGTLDFYLLPLFRERSFAGVAGRPRPGFAIDDSDPLYTSSRKNEHVDVAFRYSHYIGDWDFGLAHFRGTNREPGFVPSFVPGSGVVLTPSYDQLQQTSLDVQATKGDWLWKLELITRDNSDGNSVALATGFEYTLTGVFDSDADIGLIGEYLFDDQPPTRSGTNNDVAIGARVAFNDVQGTELLAFSVVDADTHAYFSSLEGSRRFGQSWRLSVESRFFSNAKPGEFFHDLRNDDYLELTLEKFF